MIPPYSGPLTFWIGPASFEVFGSLVAVGVLTGHAVAVRLGEQRGIPGSEIRSAAAWALVAGFFGAHALEVIAYHPEKFTRDGMLTFLKVWDGISSFGGFFGALAGVATYFAMLRKSWWAHADSLVEGLVVGWVFGRLGCTLTSDHMGRLSDFLLAFGYASGARHNLGFYEFAYTVMVLVPTLLLLHQREQQRRYQPGIYVAVICALYAPVRFALDFLRASDIAAADPRYFGLTAGQYSAIAMLAMALLLIRRLAAMRGPHRSVD